MQLFTYIQRNPGRELGRMFYFYLFGSVEMFLILLYLNNSEDKDSMFVYKFGADSEDICVIFNTTTTDSLCDLCMNVSIIIFRY